MTLLPTTGTTVTTVHDGRFTAEIDDERVLFLVGMRINRFRAVRSWAPVVAAMPRMVRELATAPELGFLDARTYVSGRVILVVQYWASVEQLHRFATDTELTHLPAWRRFNRRVAAHRGDVGIFHETYRVTSGSHELLYADMPTFGLALAGRHLAADRIGRSARRRLARRGADDPVVAAPAEPAQGGA